MTRIAVLPLLLLAGCNSLGWPKPPAAAADASGWTKPGGDAAGVERAGVERAFDDCLALASTATETDFDIDQDIAASRGSDLQRTDFAGAPLRDAQQSNRDRARTIVSSCMTGKGFVPAP